MGSSASKQKPFLLSWQNIALVLTSVILVLAPQIVNRLRPSTKASVEHCHDGDTCRVVLDGGVYLNVRLAGIDAPEVAGKHNKQEQPLARLSQQTMEKWLVNQPLEIRQIDLDMYNRPVVEIRRKKKLMNCRLLEEGLAEVYRGRTSLLDRKDYDDCEAKARRQKRGIWGLTKYLSPKEFRTIQKRPTDKRRPPAVRYHRT